MSKSLFITGTDTGVGKTVASAAIIRSLLRKGIRVGAMKPVETGCAERAGKLQPSDGMILREMAEMEDPMEVVTPVRFEEALAPAVAADLTGKPVDLDAIRHSYERLSSKYECLIVEGVGGLLVPVASRGDGMPDAGLGRKDKDLVAPSPILNRESCYFVADLVRDLELPTIVVASASLGTINHTLLTLHYALSEGIEVVGLIINHPSPPDHTLAEKTNPRVLEGLCPVPILGILPYKEDLSPSSIEKLAAHLDLASLPL